MGEKTVRQACRDRETLGGADAQALEHALTQVEGELSSARAEVDDFKSASLLEIGGDPADIKPHHVEDEISTLRAEVERATKKSTLLEAKQTFCPDCRDKVQGEPCQRCEVQRLKSDLTALLDAAEELPEWHSHLDPAMWPDSRWPDKLKSFLEVVTRVRGKG